MSRESNDTMKALVADRKAGSDVVQSDFSHVTGRVLTLGDVHGAGAISDVLTLLKEDDRLVLVGDLMDRGPQTADFMQRLIEDNGRQIVAVRGNHEEMFLQYVRAREISEKSLSSDRVFIKKIFEEKLNLQATYSRLTKAGLGQEEATFLCNGGFWAESVELDELQKMAKYVDALPYIRQVLLKDNQQFLVCHADMSMLDDADVAALLRGEKNLSVEEKAALTWARKESDEVSYASYKQERDSTSQRVYVGHEITTRPGIEVVRRDTNHVNLDFGAYAGLPLVGIEHPNKVVVIGELDQNVFGESRKLYFSQLAKLHATIGKIEFSSESVSKQYLAYVQKKKFRVLESHLLAVAPVPVADPDKQSRKLDVDAFERNLSKGGLNQEQLYQVMQSMRVGFSSDATLYQTDGRDGETTSLLFSMHEKAVHNGPTRCVINIAGTLSELNRVDPAQHHVDASDLMRVLSDIAKMNKPVDCIQIPLAAGEDRKHFLHLQIFKKEGGIGVRIIDSTTNHPLATVPTDFVQSVLSGNASSLKSILKADSTTVHPLTVVRTGEQLRPADKKCGLYVVKGIEATTQAVLSEGPASLAGDKWAENVVRSQHHLVSKTDEMAVVFQLTQPMENQPVEGHHEANISTLETPLLGNAKDEYVTEEDFADADADYNAVRVSNPVLDAHKKIERIIADLDKVDHAKLSACVKNALEDYIKERRSFGGMFRQLSGAGREYAVKAKERVDQDPCVIIREILHTSLKNGKLEVDYNSRSHHLLKSLCKDGLFVIDESKFDVGRMMGAKLELNDVFVLVYDEPGSASSSLSESSTLRK